MTMWKNVLLRDQCSELRVKPSHILASEPYLILDLDVVRVWV